MSCNLDNTKAQKLFFHWNQTLNTTLYECNLNSLEPIKQEIIQYNKTCPEFISQTLYLLDSQEKIFQFQGDLLFINTLDTASDNGCLMKVQYIYNNTLLPNCTFPVTLPGAVRNGRTDIVTFLIENNIDLNKEDLRDDYKGETPLIATITSNQLALAELLLKAGANITYVVDNHLSQYFNQNALDIAQTHGTNEMQAMLKQYASGEIKDTDQTDL